MSGHSHWASIKHKKGAADAKKGKVFSKLAKNIMMAAKAGGNPDDNLRLRYAIDAAREVSMPKDSIERAIKKGTGELEGGSIEELTYEGIGPGGASLVIEVLTDNRNRTASELRTIIDKRGGTMGKAGSVSWKFDRKGIIEFPKTVIGEEELFEIAIEAGAENLATEDDRYVITSKASDFDAVRGTLQKALEARRPKPDPRKKVEEEKPLFSRCELTRIPQNTIPIDASKAPALLALLTELEDHEDVQNIASDFELPDEVLKAVLAGKL
jgi:YebC/PmpR family DNA-binding regulatory protein